MKTKLTIALLLAAVVLPASAQQPGPAERAAMLKATMAASQAVLKQYEWIETTIVSVKGDEKSRKQERCYYGADGKIQKVLLNQSVPPPKKRGLRGRIAAAKTEELTEYMKEAVSLVREYVPPDPARIQAAKNAGKVSLQPLPWKRARLTFTDYYKSGDSFALEVDLNSNRPASATVNSYLDSDKDAITLSMKFGTLNDGTTYQSESVLNAKAKKLQVTVQNSGYRKTM